MKIVKGDLLWLGRSGIFDVIIHGCNCFNTMGAGIARTVKIQFPEAYLVDLTAERGTMEKLGTYTCAVVDCYPDDHADTSGRSISGISCDSNGIRHHKLTVVNAYTQWRPAMNTIAQNNVIVHVRSTMTRFVWRFEESRWILRVRNWHTL